MEKLLNRSDPEATPGIGVLHAPGATRGPYTAGGQATSTTRRGRHYRNKPRSLSSGSKWMVSETPNWTAESTWSRGDPLVGTGSGKNRSGTGKSGTGYRKRGQDRKRDRSDIARQEDGTGPILGTGSGTGPILLSQATFLLAHIANNGPVPRFALTDPSRFRPSSLSPLTDPSRFRPPIEEGCLEQGRLSHGAVSRGRDSSVSSC